jgi:poly [ADP-ribose] polymerase
MFKEIKLKIEDIEKYLKTYTVEAHRVANKTDAKENNNKFFSIELLKSDDNWYVYTNYGRVEDREFTGAVGIYGPSDESEMRSFFEKKFAEKVRPSKGYLEIKFIKAKVGSPKARQKLYSVNENEVPDEKKKKFEESVKAHSSKPKIDLHPTVRKLVNQWYRDNGHAISSNSAVQITSDGICTPLGVLTFGMVDNGRKILGEIGQAIKAKDKDEVAKLTSHFYSVIPTKLGRKITESDMISTDSLVQTKLDLLDMMDSALEVGGKTFNSDDEVKYIELGLEAYYLDKNDPEYIRLEEKVQKTRAKNHSMLKTKVRNILKVSLKADSSRYTTCGIKNEQELWHGSRNLNIIGILKKGLLIAPPEAPRSGLAFGRGLYLADKSTKSLNYSLYPFPNMGNVDNCFLFVVSAKLGKQMKVHYGRGDEADCCRNKGYDSVFAEEGQGLYNNEFIVPTIEQSRITHIIELER